MDNYKFLAQFNKLKGNSSEYLSALVLKQVKKLDKSKALFEKIEWKYDSDYDVEKCPCCDRTKELRYLLNEFQGNK